MASIRTARPAAAPSSTNPTYRVFCDDALDVLKTMPADSIDMCMTSPPYWGHRDYDVPDVGQEPTYEAFRVIDAHNHHAPHDPRGMSAYAGGGRPRQNVKLKP